MMTRHSGLISNVRICIRKNRNLIFLVVARVSPHLEIWFRRRKRFQANFCWRVLPCKIHAQSSLRFTLLHLFGAISFLFVVVLVRTRSIDPPIGSTDAPKPIAACQHDMHLTSQLLRVVWMQGKNTTYYITLTTPLRLSGSIILESAGWLIRGGYLTRLKRPQS